MKNFGKKMRGIKDNDLNMALLNHAGVLQKTVVILELLLRERKLLLVLNVVQSGAIVWALLTLQGVL